MKPFLESLRKRTSKCVLLVTFGFTSWGHAATYYVALDGDNGFTGSDTQPWRTINHAAAQVSAGDTVIVRPGEYHEMVQTEVGGTAENNRVTFVYFFQVSQKFSAGENSDKIKEKKNE